MQKSIEEEASNLSIEVSEDATLSEGELVLHQLCVLAATVTSTGQIVKVKNRLSTRGINLKVIQADLSIDRVFYIKPR